MSNPNIKDDAPGLDMPNPKVRDDSPGLDMSNPKIRGAMRMDLTCQIQKLDARCAWM